MNFTSNIASSNNEKQTSNSSAQKEQYIDVILCAPGKKARVTTIMNNLKSLQHMVGDSFIEAIYPFDDPVAIVCDEEGKLRNATLNRSLRDENGNIS